MLSTQVSLSTASYYWTSSAFGETTLSLSTPTYSNINSPARHSTQPTSGPQFFTYSEGIMADILSKREYLYRQYFTSKGFKMILPDYFKSSPTHPLLSELRTLVPSTDPINLSSESSRDLFYHHSSLFNTSLVHNMLSVFNYNSTGLPLNLNFFTKYVLTYFTGTAGTSNLSNDTELLRNQYRPMKKGVSNMIKLHATGAVAMPIETRLHLLASSKDVIHS